MRKNLLLATAGCLLTISNANAEDAAVKKFEVDMIYSSCIENAFKEGAADASFSKYCRCVADKESEEFSIEDFKNLRSSSYLQEKESEIINGCLLKYADEFVSSLKK